MPRSRPPPGVARLTAAQPELARPELARPELARPEPGRGRLGGRGLGRSTGGGRPGGADGGGLGPALRDPSIGPLVELSLQLPLVHLLVRLDVFWRRSGRRLGLFRGRRLLLGWRGRRLRLLPLGGGLGRLGIGRRLLRGNLGPPLGLLLRRRLHLLGRWRGRRGRCGGGLIHPGCDRAAGDRRRTASARWWRGLLSGEEPGAQPRVQGADPDDHHDHQRGDQEREVVHPLLGRLGRGAGRDRLLGDGGGRREHDRQDRGHDEQERKVAGAHRRADSSKGPLSDVSRDPFNTRRCSPIQTVGWIGCHLRYEPPSRWP